MSQLDNNLFYELTSVELSQLQQIFTADFCNDDEAKQYIKDAFAAGYLMDPHTATCFKAYDTCRKQSLTTIAYSTAEWTKFSPTIASALTGEQGISDIDALESIAREADIVIPEMIKGLFDKEIAQNTIIDKQDIEKEILDFL